MLKLQANTVQRDEINGRIVRQKEWTHTVNTNIRSASQQTEIDEQTDRRGRNTVSLNPLSSRLVRTAFAYHATPLSHDLSQAGSDHTSLLLLLVSTVNKEQTVLRSG